MKLISHINKLLILLLLSIGVVSPSYAGLFDDWTDNQLCEWMDQPSPPGIIESLVSKRLIICSKGVAKQWGDASNTLDGSYSFTLSRFNPSEGSRDLGRGVLEILDGKISVAKESRWLDTSSTKYYDTFKGQIDIEGNIIASFDVNALHGKGSPRLVGFSGSMDELQIKGKFDDYFEMIIKIKPAKSLEPVNKVGEAANSFDGSYAFIIRTEPTDGEKNIGTAQFIIKDGKISVARKYRYLLTSSISSYDTFEGVIDKEGNIKVSFELNPIRHMVEPKNIKLSGSMDSLQLRGRFDEIKFWDNNTKEYVPDENFYTSFYDVIIDFKKENY